MERFLRILAIAGVACLLVVTAATAAVEGSGSRVITKKQYGKRWPFTVPRGLLTCRSDAVRDRQV